MRQMHDLSNRLPSDCKETAFAPAAPEMLRPGIDVGE